MARSAQAFAAVSAGAAAAAAGYAASVVARHGDSSLGGGTWLAVTLQVITVIALAAVGGARLSRPESRYTGGLLLGAAAGFALAIAPPEFVSSDVWFTASLATAGAGPLLCVCAVLPWPRAPHWSIRVVAGSVVVPVLVSGLVPTLLFEPRTAGCNSCAANLLAVASAPDARETVLRSALIVTLVWDGAALLALAARWRRLPRGEWTVVGPPIAAAAALAALSGAMAAHQLGLPVLGIDHTVQLLWPATCLAAALLAAAVAATAFASRRAAQALTRDLLSANSSLESLRRGFAKLVGDPDLAIVLNPASATGPDAVRLARGDDLVAEIRVDSRYADAAPRLGEAVRAAGLALEYAAARDALTREEAELRESRRRVVHTGDAARYAVERNLHDGAQQRLLAIALHLVSLRRGSRPPQDIEVLDDARGRLASAMQELRLISHGLFPASLRDDGLVAALREYQATSPVALEVSPDAVDGLDAGGLEDDAAMAAYRLVVDAARALDGETAEVNVTLGGDDTRFEITLDATSAIGVAALQHAIDRFHALDGEVAVVAGSDGCRISGWVPCAS